MKMSETADTDCFHRTMQGHEVSERRVVEPRNLPVQM